MPSAILDPLGRVEVTLAAGDALAVYSLGSFFVYQKGTYNNVPDQLSLLTDTGPISAGSAGSYVSSTFASGAVLVIEAYGGREVRYETGASAAVKNPRLAAPVQPTPGVLNATGTLTAAMLLSGIVTSTSGAAVAATLDTGAIMEAASDWGADDSITWSVINTGGNTFTVTASAGHTIVGVAAVVTVTSALFRTRRSAASTFITYRLA